MGHKNKAFSLLEAVRETVHNSDMNIDDLADLMGCSSNLLYRMAVDGPSGTKFIEALQKTVQLTRITKNDTIIRTLARLTGYIIVKEPRGTLGKKQRETVIADFNLEHALILKTLSLFLTDPNETLKTDLVKMLTEHMERTAQMRRQVQKDKNQHDLFADAVYKN